MVLHWFWVVGWFITLFGFLGNTWIIFIIVKRRRLQTTANWFVLSLAIADLGVTCGYFPASFVCNILVHSCNNSIRFNFYSFFIEASTFSMIAMIVERYIAIVYSLRYVYVMTTAKTITIIVASWGVPSVLIFGRWAYELYYNEISAQAEFVIITMYTLLFEIVPTIILIVATSHILFIARRVSKQMSVLLTQVRFNVAANSARILNAPVKIGLKSSTVKLVVAVVAIFVVCYGTEIYVTFCQAPYNLCAVPDDVQTFFSLLIMVNSVLNPIVYAFLKQDIKNETRAVFRFGKDSRSHSGSLRTARSGFYSVITSWAISLFFTLSRDIIVGNYSLILAQNKITKFPWPLCNFHWVKIVPMFEHVTGEDVTAFKKRPKNFQACLQKLRIYLFT